MEPILVGVVEAARVLGISERGLRGMIADGKLDSVRMGRRRLLRVADLRMFAQARRTRNVA